MSKATLQIFPKDEPHGDPIVEEDILTMILPRFPANKYDFKIKVVSHNGVEELTQVYELRECDI